jgi:serine/threonine protein kinase
MLSLDIVHGDIKPENVLMFNQSNKPVIAKVADFGYSCRFTTERSRLKLPISRPWNAPEHTRSSREWTFKQAVKTDIFSYGMLCLWTLYHDYFRDVCTDDDSRYGISTVKDDLRPLSRRLVTEDPNLTVNQRRSLEEFFSSCLHDDPEQRESSMLKLLQKLNTEQWVLRRHQGKLIVH